MSKAKAITATEREAIREKLKQIPIFEQIRYNDEHLHLLLDICRFSRKGFHVSPEGSGVTPKATRQSDGRFIAIKSTASSRTLSFKGN